MAVTLPDDTVRALQDVDPDLGWAIVGLLDRQAPDRKTRVREPQNVELVAVGARRSLIVVNRSAVRSLPGVNIVPLSGSRAFLALEPGRGLSDLELAVVDRLGDASITSRERQALSELRAHLSAWRRDHTLQFHLRAIIVVEQLPRHGAAVASGGRRLA